jgi:hypothetical protein
LLGVRRFSADRAALRAAHAEPLQWQVLALIPAIGVVAGFIGLRLYERLLRR